eukprot:TRINITY_DN2948_c0_g1_i1.p2 TRINITY_DN2948_c0_g1~~TRINITY_DN2948_c0_g1_i1.p2  ORF type:complete len:91 (+),score=7.20 TRINITY_DN2948_c0_g1_i1:33-305(+)
MPNWHDEHALEALGFGCKLPKDPPEGIRYDGTTWLVGCTCGGCKSPKMHGVTCDYGFKGNPGVERVPHNGLGCGFDWLSKDASGRSLGAC